MWNIHKCSGIEIDNTGIKLFKNLSDFNKLTDDL